VSDAANNPFGGLIDAALRSGPDEGRSHLRRVADAVRGIIEQLAATSPDRPGLEGVAIELERLAVNLAQTAAGRGYDSYAESANAGTTLSFFDHSPVIGGANPLAPPAYLRMEGDKVIGTVTFGAAYEGPPGYTHGGYVAAVFDELLGMTQSLSGQSGMTGTLTVRYRRPTPLNQPIDLEGELVRVEGRKVFVAGRSRLGEDVLAESEGIFISLPISRFVDMMAQRDRPGS
jgi:acyl-coenzyme A thioesterase PaaI-like protein